MIKKILYAYLHGQALENSLFLNAFNVVDGQTDEQVHDDDAHDDEEDDEQEGGGLRIGDGLAGIKVALELKLADHHDRGLEQRRGHLPKFTLNN